MARWDLMLNYTRGTPALSKNTMFQDFWPPISNLIGIWLLINIWLSFSINYVFIFLSYFWTPQWILLSSVHLTILFAFSQKMLLSCCQYEYIYTFLSVVSSPLSHLFLIVPHSVCTLQLSDLSLPRSLWLASSICPDSRRMVIGLHRWSAAQPPVASPSSDLLFAAKSAAKAACPLSKGLYCMNNNPLTRYLCYNSYFSCPYNVS